MPEALEREIASAADLSIESAGVLLAAVAEASNGEKRILARGIRWVDDSAYDRRDRNGLTIRPEGYIEALAEAERIGAMCIWTHTHPGPDSSPQPSNHDRYVDDQIRDLFQLRAGSRFYGALIVSRQGADIAFTGHLEEDGVPAPIDHLWSVGERFRLSKSFGSAQTYLSSAFDRNVRAFGSAVQATLGELRIGIVGCGGTGSVVAEQLVRLGVRHLTLVDPDLLSESNVTRVYGSALEDVGKPKVSVLAHHLLRVAPELVCDEVRDMITRESAARSLVGCDLVFGCTDDNAGRLVLSRFSSYLLTPVIDCGVLLSSGEKEQLNGIDGRVTVLSPGQACLTCRGRVDLQRAAAELLSPDERARREDEGYAPALARTEPAVVAFTTFVGSAAVGEMLERIIGYGPDARPSELILRIHDREISGNVESPKPEHYCNSAGGKLGVGITDPFLEQTWRT